MIKGEKFLKQARIAGIFGLACLVITVFVETNKIREEEEMRLINVPVEVTDAQYYALESLSFNDAQKEAELIAASAITSAAEQRMHEIATKYDPMPRNGGFGMEVADIEYLVLMDEIEKKALAEQSALSTENHTHTPSDAPQGLTASGGIFMGPSGKESWYDLPMDGIVGIMRGIGYSEEEYPYWVREDGCKMLGQYIMCAANLELRPRGTILRTSLGEAIVCDTGGFAASNPTQVDIATSWSH